MARGDDKVRFDRGMALVNSACLSCVSAPGRTTIAMAIETGVEWAMVGGLFFVTMGTLLAALVRGIVWARKTPAEVLQLRIFENHRAISWGSST